MSPPQLSVGSSQLPMALIRDGGGAGGAVGRALLCLSLAVLALPFCAAQEGDAQAQTASQKKQVVLQAAGASFPNLVYQDLIFAYQFVAPHVKMSYLSTGSGAGQCRIKDFTANCAATDKFGSNHIDWAGSDSLFKAADYVAYPDLQLLPTVAGGIVPVYNIPLLNKAADEVLVLDRTTMAYVFTGNISKWNDPRILALQTLGVKAKMQNEEREINLVVRDDDSGSTEVMTKSLNLFSNGDFKKYAGAPSNKKTVWNGVVAAHGKSKVQYKSGAEGVAAGVLLTPWSIGYSSSGEAELHSLPIPRFRQNDRQRAPIKADINSIAFAMLEKGLQFGNNGDEPSRLTADIMDASGDEAWPIATFTYLVLRNGLKPAGDRIREGATCDHVKATIEFWNWFYTSELADLVARRNFFVPLPDLVKQPVLEKLRNMRCNGELALKDAEGMARQKVVAAGVVDELVGRLLSLYTQVYKSVDPVSDVTITQVPSSSGIDVSKRLLPNEAFKVVLGDDVYRQPWVAEDRSIVLVNGRPVDKRWNQLYPETGQATSMVFPLYTFAIHFVVNIPGQTADQQFVLTPRTLRKILNGLATNWTDADIAADNPWINTISPRPGYIKLIVSSARDSIYEVLKTAYSDGFPEWDKSTTARYTTYEQLNAVVTGSPGSITYGPHTGELPKAAKFAALKWTDAPEPVLPSHNTVLECTKASDAFDAVTRQYTPRPTRKGCYPLAVTANVIFHHSFSDLEKHCFVDTKTGSKGIGAAGVQFWKWMLESGPNVEEAIVRSKAVPLVHTANNTDQILAVTFTSDTIHCAHPPDPIVTDDTMTYIISACAGGGALLLILLVGWFVMERHAMMNNPLRGVNVLQVIKDVHRDCLPIKDGKVATYIPELGKVDPELFAIAICTVDGKMYKYGDFDHEFSIQSMSKPLAYAHALQERGFEYMKTKVNVEPAGGAFDTIDMDSQKRPFNPFINSGAIAVAMQLHGDMKLRYQEFRQVMSGFCNKNVILDEKIYKSESATAARNRQIADILLANGICIGEYDKEQGLEAYFMMCSTLLNTVDLACLAATAANQGTNPISKKHIVGMDVNEEMMSVMMTCGMYNGAGNWMVDVGIPAKSGVGGGIFGVVPGVCGIAVFSPRLNPTYNSVRGIQAFVELSQRLGLHVLQKKKTKPNLLEVLTRRRKQRFSNSQVAAGLGVNRSTRTQSAVWGKAKNEDVSRSFKPNSIVPGIESFDVA